MFGRRIQFLVIGLLITTKYILVTKLQWGRVEEVIEGVCTVHVVVRLVATELYLLLVVVVYGKQLFMLLSVFSSYSITVCNLLCRFPCTYYCSRQSYIH